MATAANWNDDFTDEQVYRDAFDSDGNADDGPTLAEMFYAAFMERANAVHYRLLTGPKTFIWRPVVPDLFPLAPPTPKGIPGVRPAGSPLGETQGNCWANSDYWDKKYLEGNKLDDPDNGIYPDPLIRHDPPPASDHYLYTSAGVGTFGNFSWQRLAFHTWQLRAFFVDPNPDIDGSDITFTSPAQEVPWPTDDGYSRKYYREINRLDAQGEDGDIARFVAMYSNLLIEGDQNSGRMNRPISIAKTTPGLLLGPPGDQVALAGKIMKLIHGSWKTWEAMLKDGDTTDPEPKQPDIVDTKVGFPRGGDIFGPWTLNEIRDGLNALIATTAENTPVDPSFFTSLEGRDPKHPTNPFRYTIEKDSGNPEADGIAREVDFYYWNGTPGFPSTGVYQKASAPSAKKWDDVKTGFSYENGPLYAIARWDVDGGFKYTKNT